MEIEQSKAIQTEINEALSEKLTHGHTCHSPGYLHSVNVPSAIEVTDQGSSQLRANVATSHELVDVLVVAFQLAGATDSDPPGLAI